MRAVAKVCLSFFGTGYAPGAPGTVASLFAILLHLCIFELVDPRVATAAMAVVALFFAVATVVWGGQAELIRGSRDPSWVVSDEVAGQLVAAIGIAGPAWMAAAFAGFRLLDIAKPFPISRCERLRGGWGILADDLAAGVIVAVALRLAGLALPPGFLT